MIEISDKEFDQLRTIMYDQTGVSLKPSKKMLMMGRLRKRLEELNLTSFAQYAQILSSSNNDELQYFINKITTNETYFFRHVNHFNYLYEHILPELTDSSLNVKVWSCASSTGEEPYSLAITLMEYLKKKPTLRFNVDASDINTEVLETAREGIYIERSLKEVNSSLRSKYFDTVEHKRRAAFQVKSAVKSHVNFFKFNLQVTSPVKQKYDVIFLRNVLIYFDRETKQKVVNNLERHLSSKGYFFISLSETLNDIQTSLSMVNSGIYQKT